jgi:hypothetical protein
MTLIEGFMFLDPETAPARLPIYAPKEIVAESHVMHWHLTGCTLCKTIARVIMMRFFKACSYAQNLWLLGPQLLSSMCLRNCTSIVMSTGNPGALVRSALALAAGSQFNKWRFRNSVSALASETAVLSSDVCSRV